MEDYIREALVSGFICLSTCWSRFLFRWKGRRSSPLHSLRPLNNITVNNRYPLPLLASAFEHLSGATIFSKSDLRNAYNVVRIREGD